MRTVTCFFLFALFHLRQVDSSRVSIAENGYSYIQVGISPDVPYDPQIIPPQTSMVLFRATNNRAYFKDVRILIPENWDIQSNPSTSEWYDQVDVKVAPPSSSHGDTPYTVQPGGCGAPGEYIHYTPDYIKSSTQPDNIATYGIPENIFVHEWAHLRYGVFDEHGYPGDVNYPVFQTVITTEPLPNVCTDDFPPLFVKEDRTTGGPCKNDPITGLLDDNCIFEIESSPSSSLMSLVNMGSVVEFCNDVTHVAFNPNKHNDMCSGESVWSILSRHPDFANNNNPPGNINNLAPTFSILKSRSSRFVLVMDVSKSMDSYNRITKMFESATRWILYDIPLNSSLGLVQFEFSAILLSKLEQIKTNSDRFNLAIRLPDRTAGTDNTCIGCGLQEALNVLRPSGEGGNIILMTDGGENVKPFISDVMNDILLAKVQVSTIAYGRDAETKLKNLCMDTGGQCFFVDDNNDFGGLSDALTGSTAGFSQAVPSFDVQVKHFQNQYGGASSKSARNIISDEFIIDSSVGRNLVLRIDYQTKSTLQRIEIKSPSGIVYNVLSNFIWDDSAKCVLFKQDFAEVGKWTFTLTVTSSNEDALLVKVTSQTRVSANTPITTQCYFPDDADVADAKLTPVRIVAKVLKGTTPVKGAKVKAIILLPIKLMTEIELLDNGVFADATKGDGIYSRYFTGATERERYSVTCEAWDDGYAYYEEGSKKILTGDFRRQENGGSIRIEKPVTVESYPPERIRDLVVYDVTTDESVFQIKFTAPGERLDQGGRVPKYKIKVSTDYKDLLEANFDQQSPNSIAINLPIDGTIASSVDPGMTEYLSLLVEQAERNKTYFIAIRSFDKSGSSSKVSNLASFNFRPLISPVPSLGRKTLLEK